MSEGEPKQVNDDELRERLRLLLAASDLATTTGAMLMNGGWHVTELALLTRRFTAEIEKKLRKQLEEEFGVSLSDKKALIRREVRPEAATSSWSFPHCLSGCSHRG